MSDSEREQREYLKRREDALDAGEILLLAVCFAIAIACWRFAVEWFFGRLG